MKSAMLLCWPLANLNQMLRETGGNRSARIAARFIQPTDVETLQFGVTVI